MSAIPVPDAAPAIALPGDDDQLRRLMAIPMGAVQPKAISSQGIPVTPQTGGKAIPINRATGQPEELNNEGKPIAPGVAGLWAKSENIHNPFLRGLAKIGSVAARAIDVAGSVAAPGIAAQIPGSTLNQKIGENRAENQQTADTENTERQAATAHTQAETAAEPTEVAYKQAQTDALNDKEAKPEDLNQQYADAVHAAVKAGKNPLEDPTVQKFGDAIQNLQKQPQQTQEKLDQQYNDAIKAGDHETAQRVLKVKHDLAAAGQAPQRPPQITFVAPGQNGAPATLQTVHTGQAVPEGAVTPGQYGPAEAKTEAANRTANATINSFTRYQNSFHNLSSKLTDKDRAAMSVLTSHQDKIAGGIVESSQAGILDTLLGQPLTGYSQKLMGGAMTKEQFDKMSPAGKKMLADYFHAILANFANMKQRLGTAGGRNQAMVQAEMNAIPLPYIDQQSADSMFNDTMQDIKSMNPGAGQQGGSSGRRVIDLTK